jgi:hypothetical protein
MEQNEPSPSPEPQKDLGSIQSDINGLKGALAKLNKDLHHIRIIVDIVFWLSIAAGIIAAITCMAKVA